MPPSAAMELKVRVHSPKADAHRVDEMARELMEEVRQLDVRGVKPAPGAPLPSGAKGNATEIGAFFVSIAPSVISPLLGLLQSFLNRPSTPGATMEIEVNGRKVSLTTGANMSAQDQAMLMKEARATLEAAMKG